MQLSLPQDDSELRKLERRTELKVRQGLYSFVSRPELAMPLANRGAAVLELPSIARWVAGQAKNNLRAAENGRRFGKAMGGASHFSSLDDFARVFQEYPVPEIVHRWREDRCFADQRLAGANPMVLQRVCTEGEVGASWQALEAKLSPALERAPLERAAGQGRLYVADYHELSRVIARPGPERGPHLETPIALFERDPEGLGLRPLAIQLLQQPAGPVHRPDEGSAWLMARIFVQAADHVHGQLVHHLGLCHLVQEAFVIATWRQLADSHPVKALLERHFTALIPTNFGTEEVFGGAKGLVARMLEAGPYADAEVVNAAWRRWSFSDLDLPDSLARRGLEDPEALPYFPYRDDGLVIWSLLGELARGWIGLFYPDDATVAADWELQAWCRELSAEAGGPGRVRGFPTRLSRREALARVLQRLLWTASGQHAALNYPLASYASFAPNQPAAVFLPPLSVPLDEGLLLQLLPPAPRAELQARCVGQLSGYRFDRLLDYGPQLTGPARELVVGLHRRLHGELARGLEEADQARVQAGHLGYGWLHPSKVPNSSSA